MKTIFIKPDQQPENLILYFAGWGTPVSAVGHLSVPENTALLACYDYQDLQLDFDFSSYQRIDLVAWSMGVWVADQVMGEINLHSATAINGTPYPSHDHWGIPVAVFTGTLQGLNEANLVKFQRRMCGNNALLQDYQQLPQQRDFADVYAELAALSTMINQRVTSPRQWTKALIGNQDRIFPVQNQRAYWQGKCDIQEIQQGHYVFHQFNCWHEIWA